MVCVCHPGSNVNKISAGVGMAMLNSGMAIRLVLLLGCYLMRSDPIMIQTGLCFSGGRLPGTQSDSVVFLLPKMTFLEVVLVQPSDPSTPSSSEIVNQPWIEPSSPPLTFHSLQSAGCFLSSHVLHVARIL